MFLGELLDASVIRVGLAAQTKDQAINELVTMLAGSVGMDPDMRKHVLETIMQREQSMSTGMEHGIALPHGSSNRIDCIRAALAIIPEGIPFDCMDGQPARIIILLIFPSNQFGVHVRHLAAIAQFLGNASFREALLNAQNADDVLQLLRSEEPVTGMNAPSRPDTP